MQNAKQGIHSVMGSLIESKIILYQTKSVFTLAVVQNLYFQITCLYDMQIVLFLFTYIYCQILNL